MFCQNCGNMLVDGAKFCAKCGTPVAANIENNAAPTIDNTPVIQPIQNEYNQSEYAPQENIQIQSPAQEPINNIPQEPVAPIYNTPEMVPVASTSPVPSEENTNQMYSQAPTQNYDNQPINADNQQFFATNQPMNVDNQQQYAANAQGMQPNQVNMQPNQMYMQPNQMNMQPNQMNMQANQMGMQANAPQNWGPMMTPKKSKKPVIIITIVLLLLIAAGVGVACFFIFGGSKGGASTPKDAVTGIVEAMAANDDDATLKYLFPIYTDVIDNVDSSKAKSLTSSLLESYRPVDKKFTFKKLEIKLGDAYDSDDLEDAMEDVESMCDTLNDKYDLKLKTSDYKVTEAYDFDGTVLINDDEYDIYGTVAKCNGKWYIIKFRAY